MEWKTIETRCKTPLGEASIEWCFGKYDVYLNGNLIGECSDIFAGKILIRSKMMEALEQLKQITLVDET